MASNSDPAATVIDGRTLRLTSLHKVMYPLSGTTKQEVLAYYAAVAPHLVRHARMRPATRKRYVDGVGTHATPGKVFFEKNLPSGVPKWVQRVEMQHSDRGVTYPLLNDASTVVWCAQMGALELHVPQWSFVDSGSGAPGSGAEPESGWMRGNPDRLVLDLDPGPGADLDACVEVALLCRAILDEVGLPSVPVTSGSKGIHLYAQLDGTQTSEQASSFAHTLALALEADHPKLIVSDMKKSLRGGKVLLDWSQNNAAKTTVAPYSLRGTQRPQVACPRRWEEIAPGLRQVELYEVIERLDSEGDPMLELAPSPEVARNTPDRPRWFGAGAAASSGELRPMQARTGTPAQVRGEEWAYEVKWDGYRALVRLRDGRITLTSRNGIDLTGKFAELQAATSAIGVDSCVLDGEIVAIDERGRPRFDLLQDGAGTLQLMLFDLLEIDGVSTLNHPYTQRRAALEALITDTPAVHMPPALGGSIEDALATSRSLQLEGIVAKRVESKYLPGERSISWVKIKHIRSQEVVVIGWLPGRGNRKATVGSLLLAIPIDGELTYVGKVGSGFTDRALVDALTKLGEIEVPRPQVDGVPLADSEGVRWVDPVYVGEVDFAHWTDSRRFRHAVWKGWRPDKNATEVRIEDGG